MSRRRELERLAIAPIPRGAAPDFVTSPSAKRSRSLMQFLSVGIIFDPRVAEPELMRLAGLRKRWVDEQGPGETSDDAVVTLLQEVVRVSLEARDPGRPLTAGISAGCDVRPLIWACQNIGVRPQTFVYGQIGNLDYDVVREINTRTQLGTVFVDTATLSWDLNQFDEATAWANDLPISPRIPAAYLMDDLFPGRDELHGYLNGPLSGGSRPPTRVVTTWRDAVEHMTTEFNPFGMRRLLPSGFPQSLFPTRPLVDPKIMPISRQLQLGIRQGQRIRPSPAPRHHYLLPFEDERWIGMWLSMPPTAVAKQNKWIRILKGLDPNLFLDIVPYEREHRRGPLRRLRIEHYYGGPDTPGVIDLKGAGIAVPENPTVHISMLATYRNNASFRQMVHESWSRILRRRIFDPSFVNSIFHRFRYGEVRASRTAMGLISVDVAIQAGRIDVGTD